MSSPEQLNDCIRFAAPIASATLVNRINPSGIISIMAPAAPVTASLTGMRCMYIGLPGDAGPIERRNSA